MKHDIKVPTTVRELGNAAEQLDMGLAKILDVFDEALGAHWWNGDHEDLTVEVRYLDPVSAGGSNA